MAIKEINLIKQPKLPKTNEAHFGIEIELISKSNYQQFAAILARNELAKYVYLQNDGSLRSTETHAHPHELCVCVPVSELERVMEKLDASLREADCIATDTCGLHVHLDMRERDAKTSFHNLVIAQGVLYKMVHPSRSVTKYSRMTQTNELDEFINSGVNRYSGINGASYAKYKTIEIRMHHGCVNASTILNWSKLLNSICSVKTKKEPTSSLADFVKEFNIDESGEKFIRERLKKYGSKNCTEKEGEQYV
jgi:hypothetical protein